MLQNYQTTKTVLQKIIIALLAVLVAALVRKFFLGSLEDKVVWITFYPAVMVAAIFGGFFSGMLSSVFCVLIVIYSWQFFTEMPFISGNIGVISTFVFLINCSLIAAISEYSRQQKIKANIQKEKAEQASQAKSAFLANMSHELRTPLNAILGFTGLMQNNTSFPEEGQKNLEIISRSGEHLLGLINNVLDIAKIESGQTKKTEVTFMLENAIYEVSQLMNQRAEAKNLQLKLVIQENLPTYIKTDKQMLKQILLNLLDNAIKFTHTGTITVHIKKETLKNQSFLILEVEDTGLGIIKKDLDKIFKPFGQSDNITDQKGTGLGLTITKQFAELLGGSISAESEYGAGSIFTAKILLVSALSSNYSQGSNKYASVKTIAPGQAQFRILIVEDQIENWLLLQRIHERIGIQVKIAKNGQQGFEMFKKWNPHLIWMDVRMPVMDGLEATKKIRALESGKDVKIVGVSAHVFKDEIQNIIAVGMDSFIKKPYHFYEIYECMNEHLGINYLFEQQDKEIEQKRISSKMLENIDLQLLKNLMTAIKKLNYEQIELVINQIQKIDHETAQTLLYYTKNLKYTEIYRLLNTHLNSEKEWIKKKMYSL